MKEYEVGYGKPPRESRFKKGICPNPAGRGKRKQGKPIAPDGIGFVTRDLLDEHQEVKLRGRTIWMSRLEAVLRQLVRSAVAGDVSASAQLLDLLEKAERERDVSPIVIHVSGGLPADLDELWPLQPHHQAQKG